MRFTFNVTILFDSKMCGVLFFRLNSDEILLVFDDRVDSKIYVFRDINVYLFTPAQTYSKKDNPICQKAVH